MRTSGGRGSTRAERENVATATARRASHVVASYPLSPTKFEKPAQRAGFFVSVVLTDMQHRFREIQPYCTPLPGAAQSALPGLRVQRCLRAGSPDRCVASPPGNPAVLHTAPGAAQSALPGLRGQRCLRAGSPDRCVASPPGNPAAPHTAPGGGAKRLARATGSALSAGR